VEEVFRRISSLESSPVRSIAGNSCLSDGTSSFTESNFTADLLRSDFIDRRYNIYNSGGTGTRNPSITSPTTMKVLLVNDDVPPNDPN